MPAPLVYSKNRSKEPSLLTIGNGFAFEMHKCIPNSNLWILPNAGHVDPVHGTNIPKFFIISKEFLGGEWNK